MKKNIIMVFMFLIMFTGCSWMNSLTSDKPSVCDGVTGSFICETIDNPETADVFLQLANYEILRKGVFKKADVEKFFNEMETYIKAVDTWSNLVVYVSNRIESVREKVGMEIFILTQYSDVLNKPIPISEFDKNLILIHIEHQKRIIQLYIED